MKVVTVLLLGLVTTRMYAQAPMVHWLMPITSSSAVAQPIAQTSATIADAPSSTMRSTCIENNGKPCPEWVHKLVGQYPPVDVREVWNHEQDHFFTFGNASRALHPDKKSWLLFTTAHAGLWAATVVAVRNHQTSHEDAHSEYPAAAFMSAMDLLIFKTVSPAISVGAPVYGMVHYSIAAAK